MLQYLKAIVGAVAAGAGATGVALVDGHVTATEWTTISTSVLAALVAVFAAPNKSTTVPDSPAPKHSAL